ncbi:hypothetical protein PUN28_015912 [Cardiocondyla obscurior]|uniref:Secreted protein n=1 Tax=Cardiocondyla obscurior TaxID=286306 RepID=A0AAW2ESH5_9HYME
MSRSNVSYISIFVILINCLTLSKCVFYSMPLVSENLLYFRAFSFVRKGGVTGFSVRVLSTFYRSNIGRSENRQGEYRSRVLVTKISTPGIFGEYYFYLRFSYRYFIRNAFTPICSSCYYRLCYCCLLNKASCIWLIN